MTPDPGGHDVRRAARHSADRRGPGPAAGYALYIGRMAEQSPEFAGLAALVTGGASGIGLASPLAGATTGAALAVDGGMQGLRLRPATT